MNNTINNDELPEEVKKQLEELHKFRKSMYNKLAPVFDEFPPEQIESKISFDRKEVVDENGNAVTECTPRLDKLAITFPPSKNSGGSVVRNSDDVLDM